MAKKHFSGALLVSLLLGACTQDGRHQDADAMQRHQDIAHCQALALANVPPLMWVKIPARNIPAKTECREEGGKMACSNFPGYGIPATEADANLKPRAEAFSACLIAMRRVAPTRAPDVAMASSTSKQDEAAAALVSGPTKQVGLLAGEPAKDDASALPGQWIKDCEQCPTLIMIPPGSFKMGGADSVDQQPQHRVDLKGFLIGRYEVTQAEWTQVMGHNPSVNKACGPNCPVDRISWQAAQTFVKKLGERTGKPYRLPTEAEWEYAARAGSRTAWSFGNDDSKLKQYAWFNDNSGGAVHAVGLKLPNPFGLHDMHGNVWEWVEDAFSGDYSRSSADGQPEQSTDGANLRVLRGGSWYSNPRDLSVSKRNPSAADEAYVFFGLRVARSVQ
jgi:formylglycine-generating enzyme required for sulfatase activity